MFTVYRSLGKMIDRFDFVRYFVDSSESLSPFAAYEGSRLTEYDLYLMIGMTSIGRFGQTEQMKVLGLILPCQISEFCSNFLISE